MLKRLLDIVIASIALVLLSPLYFYVAHKVKKNLGSPVLFRQVRPGLHGKPFEMIKFRTMKDALDEQGNPLPDSERLTPFGKMLRSTSLDEMPELWNVIKGDMSVVGPRPLLMEYLSLYNPSIAHVSVEYGPNRVGDIPHSLASVEKAKRLLHYQPQFSFSQGLKEAVDWYWNNL